MLSIVAANSNRVDTMSDRVLIGWGGGAGGVGVGLPKNFFRPFGPQFGLKIRGGGPPAPPLDPSLQ